MTRQSIWEYAAALRPRYLAASRAEKSTILDEMCRVTGYHRKAAIRLLRRPASLPSAIRRRGRPLVYERAIVPTLVQVWEASDRLCSKRLAPFLPELVAVLERHGELRLSDPVRAQLSQLSPVTIDRLLKPTASGRHACPGRSRRRAPA